MLRLARRGQAENVGAPYKDFRPPKGPIAGHYTELLNPLRAITGSRRPAPLAYFPRKGSRPGQDSV